MAQDLINEMDPGETPGVEGQTEAGSEPETREDAKTEVASASGADVPGVVSTGLEADGVSESSETAGTEGRAEDLGPSGSEDTKAEPGDSPANTAFESSFQSVKGWCLLQHKRVIAGLVLGLSISPFVAHGLKHWHAHPGGIRQKVASTQAYRASIKSDSRTLLDLAAFVVLLPEDEDQAYFSLSISVRLSNTNVYREIEGKGPLLRGVIYGVLNKAVKAGSPQMISKEKLKRDIIGALNGLLVTGNIDDIYFTDFLVV
jgi:flagellar basal body-associated protein FliL